MNREFLVKRGNAATYDCEKAKETLSSCDEAKGMLASLADLNVDTLYIFADANSVYRVRQGKDVDGMNRITYAKEWAEIKTADLPKVTDSDVLSPCVVSTFNGDNEALAASESQDECMLERERESPTSQINAEQAAEITKVEANENITESKASGEIDYAKIKEIVTEALSEFIEPIIEKIKDML